MDFYKMDHPQRGIALIINNKPFGDLDDQERRRAEQDIEHVQEVFANLGFRVDLKQELTGAELSATFQTYAKLSYHLESDCFICVLIGYGVDDGVSHNMALHLLGTDGRSFDVAGEANRWLSNSSCEALNSKPKLFFVNAMARPKQRNKQAQEPAIKQPQAIVDDPSGDQNDFFFGFSSLVDGTLYLRAIANILSTHSGAFSFSQLALMSQREMRELGGKRACHHTTTLSADIKFKRDESQAAITLKRNILASGSQDHTVKLWNVDTGECTRTFKGHTGAVDCLVLVSNYRLATGSSDKTIKIWNLESGDCVRTLVGHTYPVTALVLLASNRLASGSWDNDIKIWNLTSGESTRKLEGHLGTVLSFVLVSANRLASGSIDRLIKIWNTNTGECVRELDGHTDAVNALMLASNDRLASGSVDRSVRVWNWETGACLWLHDEAHLGTVLSLVLASNNRLASSSTDKTIKIWDVDTGDFVSTLKGHQGTISCLSLVAHTRLASGSRDRKIKIWEWEAGECVRTLEGHTEPIRSLLLVSNNGLAPTPSGIHPTVPESLTLPDGSNADSDTEVAEPAAAAAEAVVEAENKKDDAETTKKEVEEHKSETDPPADKPADVPAEVPADKPEDKPTEEEKKEEEQ